MRRPLFMIWAALRWVPLMFLIAPAMEAPLVAHLNEPSKPIKTWVGNASWYGDHVGDALDDFHKPTNSTDDRFQCRTKELDADNQPFGDQRHEEFDGLQERHQG